VKEIQKGKFISFSGIDGVGKSTMMYMVAHHLQKSGIEHRITDEPSTFGKSKHIRKLVKEKDFSDNATLCLVTAARVETINHLIKPTLESGGHVLTHRWLADSRAYQDYKLAGELHKLLCDNLMPDLQLVLDAPVQVCVERIKSRDNNEPLDRFDMAPEEVMESRRSMFLRQVFEPGVAIIDANYTKEIVFDNIMKHLKEVLK